MNNAYRVSERNPYGAGAARCVHGVAIRLDVNATFPGAVRVWFVGPHRYPVVWVSKDAAGWAIPWLESQPDEGTLLAEAADIAKDGRPICTLPLWVNCRWPRALRHGRDPLCARFPSNSRSTALAVALGMRFRRHPSEQSSRDWYRQWIATGRPETKLERIQREWREARGVAA